MRWRLVAVLVGFTAIVLLVQTIPLASYLRTVERDRLVTSLEREAFTIAGASTEVLEAPVPQPSAALTATVEAYGAASGATVVVVDRTGKVVAASQPADVGRDFSGPARPEIQLALDGQVASGERESQKLGEPIVYVAVPVRSGASTLGAVRLTYPLAEFEETIDQRVRGLLVAAFITLCAAAVIAVLVSTGVTRRVRRLRDAAERIAEGDLTARAEVSGGGEIEELAEAFNTMAERVEGVVESQRGFAGDASHQLRTPLTALRLRLDRAAELMSDDDPAVGQVDAARDEIDRLQRLVDGLLVLARAEGVDHETVPVDVSQVAADRVESWQPLADEREVAIVLDAPGMAVARAVPGATEQIIDNYVDNALEVAPSGTTILVTVRLEAAGVLLLVDDEGPGLPAEDRSRAFDRFWRGRQDTEGSGLGLAVVASLAEAGGGQVWLAQSPRGGLRAAARFAR
ncbi:MAG: HAMP domain-containing protein [Candidatus Nanopelagicales bacterium]